MHTKTYNIITDLCLNGPSENGGVRTAKIIILPPRFPCMPVYHLLINRDRGKFSIFYPCSSLLPPHAIKASGAPPRPSISIATLTWPLHQPGLVQKIQRPSVVHQR